MTPAAERFRIRVQADSGGPMKRKFLVPLFLGLTFSASGVFADVNSDLIAAVVKMDAAVAAFPHLSDDSWDHVKTRIEEAIRNEQARRDALADESEAAKE